MRHSQLTRGLERAAVCLSKLIEALLTLSAGVGLQGGAFKLGELGIACSRSSRFTFHCLKESSLTATAGVVETRFEVGEENAAGSVTYSEVLVADTAVDVCIACRCAVILGAYHRLCDDVASTCGRNVFM